MGSKPGSLMAGFVSATWPGTKVLVVLMTGWMAAAVVLCSCITTQAQWSYASLHPAGALHSIALGTTDSEQVGWANFGAGGQAARWSGTAASFVDLAPGGSTVSQALATAGGQQAGYANFGGGNRAGYWLGTPGTWVNINPALSVWSEVRGTSGSQQVGYANFLVGGFPTPHASLWDGSALTHHNLNPPGALESIAESISGTQQAGGAKFAAGYEAGTWSGTDASWTSLHPSSASQSYALSTSGTQQVGYTIDAGATHAALWSGTAASYISLHPTLSLAFDSSALATLGLHQVGWVMYTPGLPSATIWSGSPESVFNLQDVLPSDYAYSEAHSIYESGGTIYVAGYAHNVTLGRTEAMLWTMVPAVGLPGDYNQNGAVDAADYVLWRDNNGSATSLSNDDTPGVGPDDYSRWRAQFGSTAGSSTYASPALSGSAIPEPGCCALFVIAGILAAAAKNRRETKNSPRRELTATHRV